MAYACPRMIRNCIDSSIKRKDIVSVITYQTLINDLQLDHNSFIDFCILCGCDYCPIIPRVGSVTALKLIHKFKTIESILENTNYQKIYLFIFTDLLQQMLVLLLKTVIVSMH